MHLPARVLICATELPPFHGGGALSLARLLSDVDPDQYVLTGFGPAPPIIAPGLPELAASVRRLPSSWRPPSPSDRYPLKHVRYMRRFGLEIARRAEHLARMLDEERFGALMVVTGPTPDVPAGWVASRLTGTPLVIYMLDDWRHLIVMLNPLLGIAAKLVERVVLPQAESVIAVSPLLARELRSAGLHVEVVGIPLPPGAKLSGDARDRPWPRTPGQIRLVFTGQVYAAHFDSIATVLQALETPGLEDVTLHLYTATPADELRRAGLRGRLVLHEHVSPPEIFEIQREADILLMALGFSTPYPNIIRTAVSTKAPEYLASDRPILVHVPPGSLWAVLAREEGVGALVDTPSPSAVAGAIRRIIDDPDYRQSLVQAQRAAALRYHSPAATTERLVEVLGLVTDGPRPHHIPGHDVIRRGLARFAG